MAISGQQNINIGAENTQSGSDSLFTAFNKVQDNFTKLFLNSSPYNTFSSGAGISTFTDTGNNIVYITNTGVTSLTAGTGVAISAQTGNIIISASGNGNVGVTSIDITSNTLTVVGDPIVSSGTFAVDLPTFETTPTFAPGDYIAPSVTIDSQGRITAIANTVGVGTVTSVAVEVVGDGLSISNSPITSSGTIYITNTGVTKLKAGPGLALSGSTGEITLSMAAGIIGSGTVTSVDFFSNSLTITGAPVTTTGNVNIDLPDDITVAGNLTVSGNSIINGNLTVNGTTETINSTVTKLVDPVIELGGGANGNALTTNDGKDRGTLLHYYTTGAVDAFMGWDNSGGEFMFASNVSVASEVITINSYGNVHAGNANLGNLATANYFSGNGSLLTSLTGANVTGYVPNANIANSATTAGTVTTNAQPNITSVGTLSSLSVTGNASANNANITNQLIIGNSTVGNVSSFDFVAGNSVTISNTGYLILNTVTDNNKFVAFSAPNSISPSYILWQLPSADGTANTPFLSTNGSGVLSFGTPALSTAPTTTTSTGVAGQIAYDSSYLYVCIGTNSWKRANLSTW